MKIELSQSDIFRLLKAGIEQEGRLVVPDESEHLMEVKHDEQGCFVIGIQALFASPSTPPSLPPAAIPKRSQPVQPPVEQDTRLVPGPPPPPAVDDNPTAEEMEQIAAKSAELAQQPRNPVKYVPARQRFRQPQAAATIEEFGKDPTDYADEI